MSGYRLLRVVALVGGHRQSCGRTAPGVAGEVKLPDAQFTSTGSIVEIVAPIAESHLQKIPTGKRARPAS